MIDFLLLLPRGALKSTLFPYTTLFRSRRQEGRRLLPEAGHVRGARLRPDGADPVPLRPPRGRDLPDRDRRRRLDRKSTRLNSSHGYISYAVFCLKKKNTMSMTRSSRCI